MSNSIYSYPISGASVCAALSSAAGPEEKWVLMEIETLTSKNCPRLGELWQETLASEVEICTQDICSAIICADQVVALDMHLLCQERVEILIEDGLVVLNNLHSGSSNSTGA